MDFAALHRPGDPFVLPNAWDVPSALALVAAGFPALGTTSLGVAAAAGVPDADGATREPTLRLLAALREQPVLLNADLEDGYSPDAAEVADLVAGLGDGVAGVNLEDSTRGELVTPERHAARVAAVKAAAPGIFLNARVDTHWLDAGADLEETLRRAHAYVDAGADGVFVPGRLAPAQVEAVTGSLPVPVNVLADPDLSLAELGALGVARVSTGSLLYRTALGAAASTALRVAGREPSTATPPYGEVQDQLARLAGPS